MIKTGKSGRILPPVITYADGVPVYAYGDILINGLCPDFQQDVIVQAFQKTKSVTQKKIKPKKSWEIKENFSGMVPLRTPCSPYTDVQPYKAISLIDGNPETLWCSRYQTQPDVEPVWIRIDLPQENVIKEIVLVPRKDDQGIPNNLSIRVSRDAWHWNTVYENKQQSSPKNNKPLHFVFEPVRAKQIWIVAGKCRPIHINYLGYDGAGGYGFSLSQVQVLNKKNHNVALSSRGASATVSSTNHGTANRNEINKMVWPTVFDLGIKRIRLMGADYMDCFEPLQWHMVEKEKGKYFIDPVADQAVTDLAENGCEVILLFFTGNWLYTPKPKENPPKGNWWLYDVTPAPLPFNPEGKNAFKKFVRFMAGHFKGRIKYYEIGNEVFAPAYWQMMGKPSTKKFCDLVKDAGLAIKEVDPKAKIILGTGGIPVAEGSSWDTWMSKCIDMGICEHVDVLGWHPFYEINLNSPMYKKYPKITHDFKKYVEEKYGFKGEYMATESNWSATYPYPGGSHSQPLTEIQKAKNMARAFVMNAGLSIPFFWCPEHDTALFNALSNNCDPGLFRNTFSCDPQSPVTVQPAYYVLRNLCTITDGARPADLKVDLKSVTNGDMKMKIEESSWKGSVKLKSLPIDNWQRNQTTTLLGNPIYDEPEFENYNFSMSNGNLLIAVYLPGQARDNHSGVMADMFIKNVRAKSVKGIDTLNGFEQNIEWKKKNGGIIIPNLVIKDYPLFLHISV
jgi:hypothetical protein